MQSLVDLRCDPTLDNPVPPDLPTMIHDEPQQQPPQHLDNNHNAESNHAIESKDNGNSVAARRERPSRACTARASARLHAAAVAVKAERRQKAAKKERRVVEEEEPPLLPQPPQYKIVTPLVGDPPLSQLPRWSLRSMWELASILNFLNVFRPLLNIKVEFSAEEFETALITPNNTLGDVHIPLLKAIPPITRMALGHNTWITVLCRKLRDWWHWVAEGELPIVASHGAEVEAYNTLDPGVRVLILKAICDIRVEQEDIRNYIDNSIKHGVLLSAFRKERIGGDSYGISYWYEDDSIIGHRLYREIRKVEAKKVKGKNVQPIPSSSYHWETVATNLDEFQDVSEKLFSSKNKTEASLGKKLKNDMLPEIEKVHKRKERLLKKQHREALLLDNMIVDGVGAGRSLRDRKPVTYTFDDYDRSINEAISLTKRKHPSPEPIVRREFAPKADASINGRWTDPSQTPEQTSFDVPSPKSSDYDEMEMDHKPELLDRNNRRRQRPQRYSAKEFVEALSDNEVDADSDDDIVGEVVYNEEYLRQRKQRRKMSSSSEGDEEYHWDEENAEDEEEEEEDDDDLSMSEDSDEPKKFKKLPGRTRRETKLRSVDQLEPGLRRSKRATKTRINYKQYEPSDSEPDSTKPETSNASEEHTDTDNAEFSMGSEDSEGDNDNQEIKADQPVEHSEAEEKEQNQPPEKSNSPDQDEIGGVRKRRLLDLNELAPGSGFEDGPNTITKDEDTGDF
ncbi:DDT domain-containing protein [Actinidia chinensis var. chinensis]|uniref:DDT domain-containing protein n=1 Tax=Actinidia chinensis var. chinensis TaxID=1590841 RepID=A0A2R6PV82_ACTCC|nr:DDT domain-containing protein [Actinidia chinensis var. chinensis]